jgi:hypothetical protein
VCAFDDKFRGYEFGPRAPLLVLLLLLSPTNLFALRLQGCLASRAFVAMAADVDALQAFSASPPGD